MKYFTKEFVNKYSKEKLDEDAIKVMNEAKMQRLFMNIYDFPTLKINFQNIKVKSFKKIAKNYIIEFERIEGSIIKSITLKNAKIIKQDNDIEGSLWLFDELYHEKNQFELHILFKKDNELNDLIIECESATETYTDLGKIEEMLPKDDNDTKNINKLLEIDDESFEKLSIILLRYLKKVETKVSKRIKTILIKRQDLIIDKINLILKESKDDEWKANIKYFLIPKLKVKNQKKIKKD